MVWFNNGDVFLYILDIFCVFSKAILHLDLILMILTDLLRKVAKVIVICSIMMILLKSSFVIMHPQTPGGP